MDLRALKIEAADRRREVELLEALHTEFRDYVERLRALIAGGLERAEFESARYALHLGLHEQEHYFSEWYEGEASLDSDIFGLVDSPETYEEHDDIDDAEGRANTRFHHVINKERRKLSATESRIAALNEGLPADVTREGIFFTGEQFDAIRQVQKIVANANRDVLLIDGYVDASVLELFSDKPKRVTVRVLTKSVKGPLSVAAKAFNAQHGNLTIRTSDEYHDRFLIIDDTDFYHFGASIKDAGKRGFMFSRIEDPTVVNALRKKLETDWQSAQQLEVEVVPGQARKEPEIKWVDQRYVTDSGIDKELQAQKFKTAWCNDDKLPRRIDLEGWEVAIIERDGHRFILKNRDPIVGSVTFIKKRVSK